MKIFGVAGYKNAGKTGLMERLVTEITGRGITVSTLKHAHHSFDIDQPGKDSHRHRSAGANQVMLASANRWALMTELRDTPEPPLSDLITHMAPVDLILVEGWKRDGHPKIEAIRAENNHPHLSVDDPTIVAIAADTDLTSDRPVFDLNDTKAIADFILAETALTKPEPFWDTTIMIDWSGGNDRGATPKKDAIWAGVQRGDFSEEPRYFRNRQTLTSWLTNLLHAELAAGRRAMVGFDFPFGYPAGFGKHLTGTDDPFALWAWFADRVTDTPKANNRFDIAGQINATLPGTGPFWGNGLSRDIADLPRKGLARTANPFPEKRVVEQAPQAKGSFTCWQLSGAGAVGSQVIMGLPVLHHLRKAFAQEICVWPFEPLTKPIALVEIWPTLFAGPAPDGMIKDAHQVQATAKALADKNLSPDHADVAVHAPVEGWILGVESPQQ
jgi:molybdopterin-guanine dinucleotide biosynthesis protein MobB